MVNYRTQVIQTFLQNTTSDLSHLYTPNMECQINVAADGGQAVSGKFRGKSWRGYSDPKKPGEIWKSFRIPWNADGEPQYKDSELSWNFSEHVEAIGMTGWDWMRRESVYVGFDIDSVVGHKAGLDNDTLEEIESKCCQLPWANLYRSTGGRGLHLYIHFENPIPTQTHSEHAALARSLLSTLTIKTGIDFHDKADCVGSILWIWHRKIEGTNGLTSIHISKDKFPNSLIPKTWRDHIPVTNRSQSKTKAIDPAIEKIYAGIKDSQLTSQHRKLLHYLDTKAEKHFWWDIDYHMLVCHTLDLAKAHKELKFAGLFSTNSSGSTDQNCFLFPTLNGGWVVRRFGTNVNEHLSWTKDENGWTKCYYNMQPSFEQAMKFFGGKEGKGSEFVFDSKTYVESAFAALDIRFNFGNLPEQQYRIKNMEDKVYIKIPKILDESVYLSSEGIKEFISEKGHFLKVIRARGNEVQQNETTLPDSIVRTVVAAKSSAGWYINVNNEWIQHDTSAVKTVLQTVFPNKAYKDIIKDIGMSILNPWILVNEPFKPEYTGERKWNKDGAQFPFAPIQGAYPYWEKVLSHIGKDLDYNVSIHPWCVKHGISNGSDYLFYWIASMFQHPTRSLPYLALVSAQQNTGKSTLHQGLRHFFKGDRGYVRANNALDNSAGFNGELHGAILAVCEEINLQKSSAYNRIKDWVTGKTLLITDKFKTSFEAVNTLHFIHCVNDGSYIPIFPGDTRITVINVSPLTYVNEKGVNINSEIPEAVMDENLRKEAPHLLYDLLNVELPEPEGRLGVPVIGTFRKSQLETLNQSPLEVFIEEETYEVAGGMTTWRDFCNSFHAYLINRKYPEKVLDKFNKRYLATVFPNDERFPKGKFGRDNTTIVGNLCLYEDEADKFIGVYRKGENDRVILVNKETQEKMGSQEINKKLTKKD